MLLNEITWAQVVAVLNCAICILSNRERDNDIGTTTSFLATIIFWRICIIIGLGRR